jgi:hypothetical protein
MENDERRSVRLFFLKECGNSRGNAMEGCKQNNNDEITGRGQEPHPCHRWQKPANPKQECRSERRSGAALSSHGGVQRDSDDA